MSVPDNFRLSEPSSAMCGGRGPDFCRKGSSCRKHNTCVYAGAAMTVKESDMIKTEVKMDIYEIDGKETHPVTGPKLTVRSVRPITARVDIVVGEHRYQVSRRDLEAALAATAHTGER